MFYTLQVFHLIMILEATGVSTLRQITSVTLSLILIDRYDEMLCRGKTRCPHILLLLLLLLLLLTRVVGGMLASVQYKALILYSGLHTLLRAAAVLVLVV